jgi:predicted RNA binding protein YcfA (HicA-like mRNA interferase family)
MKRPRDRSGSDHLKALGRLGYRVTRQSGSQMRLSTDRPAPHHLTMPAHEPPKVESLPAILSDGAAHLKIERDALLRRLFA